jgi:hypothetical protein
MESSVPFAGSGEDLKKQKIPTRHHPEGIDPEASFSAKLRFMT